MKAIVKRITSSPLLIDSFWAVTGNAMTKVLAFLSAIVVARILEKELYGEYGLLRNIVVNIGMLSTFGLGYSATKFIAEAKKTGNNKQIVFSSLRITVVISSTLAFLLFLFSDFVAKAYFELPHLSFYLKLVAGWIILNAITTTQTGVLAGYGAFKEMAKWNLIVGIITFISTLIGVVWFDFFGAVISLVFSQLVNVVLFAILIKRCGSDFSESNYEKGLSKKLMKFSTPLALQEIIYGASSILVFLIILWNSNNGQLGIFNAATQWSSIVLFIPSILRNVMLKHFSAQNDDIRSLQKVVSKSLTLNLILTAAPVLILIVGFPLINGMYGDSFQGLFEPVLFLLVSTVFMSMSNVYNQYFMSVDRNWMMFWMRILRDFGILLIGYILILTKLVSASTALSIAYLFANICYFLGLSILFRLSKNNVSDVQA